MTKRFEFTELEVISASKASSSTKEFLIALGMKVNNGNYRRAEEICLKYKISLPRSAGSSKQENVLRLNKLPDEIYFAEGVLRDGRHTKKRLINDHGVKDICLECGQEPFWNGKPLTLQLDHIDGNRFNNKIENLRILCGHCHSQTETYSNNRGVKFYNYCECGIKINFREGSCLNCSDPNQSNLDSKEYKEKYVPKGKTNYPELEILLHQIANQGASFTARELGITSKAIEKHLRKFLPKDAFPLKRTGFLDKYVVR